MQKLNFNAILLRQEDSNNGTGVPPIVYDFDIEKVKASGLFIDKNEHETTIKNYSKQIKDAENNGYKKLGDVLDNVSKEIATITGIERTEIEKEGKKEREQLNEYIKRVLTAKTTEPIEKEKQLREIFTKREKELLAEKQELEQSFVSLRYSNELQGAMSELLVGITDKQEYANNQDIFHALVVTKYPYKEFSKEHKRFIYKDSEGNILLNKLADPITTNEILAEVAKILPQRQQTKNATPSGLGNPKTNNSKPVTMDDILLQLEKDGITISNPEFSKKLAEYKKNNGLT
jgi:hypothetical protein